MYSVGQTVLYGTNGVCNISEITTKKVGKLNLEYYVLKPICSDSSTLFVPTQNEQLVSKIRFVLNKEQIKEILQNLPDSEEWISNKNDRINSFKDVIASGDCYELIKLIRIINNHEKQQIKKGKHLHIADERILKEARKMVCDELSVVLKIPRNDVMELILK